MIAFFKTFFSVALDDLLNKLDWLFSPRTYAPKSCPVSLCCAARMHYGASETDYDVLFCSKCGLESWEAETQHTLRHGSAEQIRDLMEYGLVDDCLGIEAIKAQGYSVSIDMQREPGDRIRIDRPKGDGRCAVCGGPFPDGSGCEFCPAVDDSPSGGPSQLQLFDTDLPTTGRCVWCEVLWAEPGDIFCSGCRSAFDRDPDSFPDTGYDPSEEEGSYLIHPIHGSLVDESANLHSGGF